MSINVPRQPSIQTEDAYKEALACLGQVWDRTEFYPFTHELIDMINEYEQFYIFGD